MASKKKNIMREKGKENVSAALDQLDNSAATVNKATAVVRRRLEELEEMYTELELSKDELEARMDSELRMLQTKYDKDTTELRTKLQISEDKLKKTRQLLDG